MLGNKLILLDGGNGHLLKSKGLDKFSETLPFDELFAAGSLANSSAPDIIRKVHEDYVQSGCDLITANSFGCTKFSLGKIGKANQAVDLAVTAAKLAKDVAEKASTKPVLVAGSLPPLQESYQVYTSQNTTVEQLKQFEEEYIELATAIAPHIDIFLFETLSSVTEALTASCAACAVHKTYPDIPWWVSFTLEDSERAVLRSGEPLTQAVEAVCENFPKNKLEAILINCCAPAAVTAGLKALKPSVEGKGIRIGGYANGFKTTTSQWLNETGFETAGNMTKPLPTSPSPPCPSLDESYRKLLTLPTEEYDAEGIILPEAYLKYAKQWRRDECGASVIGGCCGVGPDHIALLGQLDIIS